ncbi:hypothetical protein TEA_019510 [Camellia sinensis var. sinensis]|uniref:Thioredoxin domain-containing protein n=1 Tax=Camellia sinensis var. sinensis TaxID=542762 RepID=A0A4S4F2J5_CAMSN|nr:hypothetical protein TEA_019510 [Camellia sinensis var. sinensis]
MAISVAAVTVRPLNSDHSTSLSSSSSSKLSYLSSLQFPRRLRLIRIGNKGFSSCSRPRMLPLVRTMLPETWIVLVRGTGTGTGTGIGMGTVVGKESAGTTNHFPISCVLHFKFVASFLLVEAKKQTFSSFDDLLAHSDKPVLVDFYATWCGPCQFMVPVLNEVSASMKDKIQVVKIDTEKYPSIADKYKIEALPTFIIFKDGEPYDRFEGALNANQLIERIESALQVKQ